MPLCRSLAVLKFAMLPFVLLLAASTAAQSKPRARDLGVPFDGTPGPQRHHRRERRGGRPHHADFRHGET